MDMMLIARRARFREALEGIEAELQFLSDGISQEGDSNDRLERIERVWDDLRSLNNEVWL